MKVCPVCKTTLFEDMEVYYGCLYRFGSEPALEKAASNLEEAAPLREGDMRRWAVRLEVRSLSDPDQVWAAELIPPYEDCASMGAEASALRGGGAGSPGVARAVREKAAVSAPRR